MVVDVNVHNPCIIILQYEYYTSAVPPPLVDHRCDAKQYSITLQMCMCLSIYYTRVLVNQYGIVIQLGTRSKIHTFITFFLFSSRFSFARPSFHFPTYSLSVRYLALPCLALSLAMRT